MKTIYFVMEVPFDTRDYQRFGIEYIQSQGFSVQVWDLSFLVSPERHLKAEAEGTIHKFPGYVAKKNAAETCNELARLTTNDVVINMIGYRPEGLRYCRALSKSKAFLVSLTLGQIPNMVPDGVVFGPKRTLSYYAKKILEKLTDFTDLKLKLFYKIPPAGLGIRPSDMRFVAGDAVNSQLGGTKVARTVSYDYDSYLTELKRKPRDDSGYILYLDENLPFHPDARHMGIEQFCKAEDLYPRLQKTFNFLEKETGKKVVIAAHPRSHYGDDAGKFFQNRQVEKNATCALVRNCSFILAHASTSVSFAVLFQKPIIFLTSDTFSVHQKYITEAMARTFEKKPVSMDSEMPQINLQKEQTIDERSYKKYKNLYLKSEETKEELIWKTFCKVILDRKTFS